MKRGISITALIFVLIVLAFLLVGIFLKVRTTNQFRKNYERLPSFSFKMLNDTLFSSTSIIRGPVLIIYFHPECEHCQYELSEIFNSSLIESDLWILLITPADKNSVLKFKNTFGLKDKDKVITLIDERLIFPDFFGKSQIPTNIIYSKDLKLIRMFKGEVRTDIIFKLIQKND